MTQEDGAAPTFDHIVAGYDGREGGREACEYAAALATALGSRLDIAGVFSAFPFEVIRGHEAYRSRVLDEVEQRLRAMCAAVGGEDVAVPRPIEDESPAHGLHEVSRDADLVVVGSSHRGAAGRVLAGDVASSLLQGAACPVLVVPRGVEAVAPRRIGVAFDGSTESTHALDAAVRLAQALEATLELDAATGSPPYDMPWPPVTLGALRKELRGVVDAAVARLPSSVTVNSRVHDGDPSAALARVSGGLDLLVGGSRGYGAIRRVAVGSVSHRLLRDAQCPLLFVPRQATRSQPAGAEAGAAAQPADALGAG